MLHLKGKNTTSAPKKPVAPTHPISMPPHTPTTDMDQPPPLTEGGHSAADSPCLPPPLGDALGQNPQNLPMYANKAAMKPSNMLARAQEILQVAPSLDLLKAIRMAETLPIKGQPTAHSSRKTVTIQGSHVSSCIIAVPTLVHQGVVNILKEKVKNNLDLQELPNKQLSMLVDGCNIVLCSTCTLSEDKVTAFHSLVTKYATPH